MEYIILSILTISVGVYILLPFASIKESYYLSMEQEVRRLVREKEELYRAIADLDFEYSSGKISEKDYQGLRSEYKSKAIAIVKELKGISGLKKEEIAPHEKELRERLEQEINSIRRSNQ